MAGPPGRTRRSNWIRSESRKNWSARITIPERPHTSISFSHDAVTTSTSALRKRSIGQVASNLLEPMSKRDEDLGDHEILGFGIRRLWTFPSLVSILFLSPSGQAFFCHLFRIPNLRKFCRSFSRSCSCNLSRKTQYP